MLRKIILFFTCGLVLLCLFSYRKALRESQGRALVAGAYYADVLIVKNEVEQGAPLDYEFYFQDEERQYQNVWFNALHAAASGGNEDIINFLLDQGFNINTRTRSNWTPLFIAARDGQAEAAKLLIYRGAELDVQTDQGATALMMTLTQHFPTEKDRNDLLFYLLRRGANANLPDKAGYTPLYYAILACRPESLEILLDYDADPHNASVKKALDYIAKLNTPEAKKTISRMQKAISKRKKTPTE